VFIASGKEGRKKGGHERGKKERSRQRREILGKSLKVGEELTNYDFTTEGRERRKLGVCGSS